MEVSSKERSSGWIVTVHLDFSLEWARVYPISAHTIHVTYDMFLHAEKQVQPHWSVWPAGMILVDLLHGEIVDNKPKQNWDGSYFITHRTVVSYSLGPRSWKSLRFSKLMFFWLPAKSGLGSVSPKCYLMFDPIVTRKSPMVPPGSTYFHQLLALFCTKHIRRYYKFLFDSKLGILSYIVPISGRLARELGDQYIYIYIFVGTFVNNYPPPNQHRP